MSDNTGSASKVSIWVESLIITFIFIVISELLNDPLSINSPFPWIWFAPVIIALHYGLVPSQLSIIVLLGEHFYNNINGIFDIHLQLFILGGFIMTITCAAWQSSWSRKITYNTGISEYLQKRIQTIAYAYRLTSLAYQRLENNYIASPVTLRTSMNELRELFSKSNQETQANILNRFINILAIHCSVEKAGIFPVKNNKLIPEPITYIGSIKIPSPNNYFIEECIETAKMTYITSEDLIKDNLSDYLIAAPLINQHKQIYALILIEELPFLSLNEENISTMNLLIEYFMEGNTVKGVDQIISKYTDCPVVFANELQRLSHLEKKTGKDSAIEVFQFLDELHQDDYIFRLKQEIRGLDSWWETNRDGAKTLLILMPFTNHAAAECYKLRISQILLDELGISLNQNEIKYRSYQISSSTDSLSLIEEIFEIK